MAIILDKEERDKWLNKLTPIQREFIQNHVKRGKKTVFANELAKDKGIVIPPNADSEDLEHLLEDWVLEDYIDNGFVNSETPCECGRPLRYQYIVKHKGTNEVRRFGIKHFEEHTDFPTEIVRKIKSGFQTIEYEMDELLDKIHHNWKLESEIPEIPEDYSFPEEVQKHLDATVPLLNRQIKRVKQQVYSFIDDSRSRPEATHVSQTDRAQKQVELEEPMTLDLFNDNPFQFEGTQHPYALSPNLQAVAFKYLKEGISSARIICELLIKNKNAPNERYESGRPKNYVPVCFYFDSLVRQKELHYEGSRGLDDRYYKLAGYETLLELQ